MDRYVLECLIDRLLDEHSRMKKASYAAASCRTSSDYRNLDKAEDHFEDVKEEILKTLEKTAQDSYILKNEVLVLKARLAQISKISQLDVSS